MILIIINSVSLMFPLFLIFNNKNYYLDEYGANRRYKTISIK